MEIQFDKEYLSELYYTGKSSDKKHRFQPKVVRNYVKRIITLADAPNIDSLYVLNSLNYEVLTGDKAGISSIRIDLKYRLEFKVEQKEEPVVTVCNILDISNHYK
jgi:proteic killer suppression protein